MRDLEEAASSARIELRGERRARWGPFDGESVPAEEQEVEVQLARTPAPTHSSAELALEALQRHQQVRRAGGRIRTAGEIERGNRIQEVGLIHDADRLRPVEARDASQMRAGQVPERLDGVRQRRARVTDVGAEPDVCPYRAAHHHLDRSPIAPGYSRRVQPVAVRILHPEPGKDAGELTRLVASARSLAADELARRFGSAGADDVRIIKGPADGLSFGERLRGLAADLGPGRGLIVLGSGSIPLANDADATQLVEVAGSGERRAITNNRYSSDVVAIGDASSLANVPNLPADNALPRWLETVGGFSVAELPDRARLALDIDSPLDLELLRRHPACPPALARLAKSMEHRLERVTQALDELAAIARNPRRELLASGRLSASTLHELEKRTACRIRALIEERGLRTSTAGQRPPASVLGMLLDRDGPDEIGMLVGRLADGAVIDSRVLLAHRFGADEAAWPGPEDRFASDLLFADRVRDPWLQQLTLHAWSHATPIALGGHTLVGPGLGLALGLAPGFAA